MNGTVCILYKNFLTADGHIKVGGIENYILRLSQALNANGYQIAIVQQHEANSIVELDAATVHEVVCHGRNPYHELLQYAEERFDIERSCLIFGAHTAVLKTKFAHALAIQHGIHWDGQRLGRIPAIFKFLYPLARFAEARVITRQINRVDRVVCVDYNFINWIRTQGCAKLPAMTVIPNFVDTGVCPIRSSTDGKNQIKIVFARRFVEKRGARLLGTVLPAMLARYPNIELTIAGEGPMEDYLLDAFSGCERVTFTKYAPQDSITFHSQFDIALVPTIFSEGTSFSLLEAMYAGCCVLCTNVGGMTNIVLDGFNGRMVSPEESQFASALEELIQDKELRNRLAANAVASVSQGFSLDSWSKRWLEVVDEVFDDVR